MSKGSQWNQNTSKLTVNPKNKIITKYTEPVNFIRISGYPERR